MGTTSRLNPHTRFRKMMELHGPREEAMSRQDAAMSLEMSPMSEQGSLIGPGLRTLMDIWTQMTQQ
jgi:hypothetical protein